MPADTGAQNLDHENALLLRRLFTSLQARDHAESCGPFDIQKSGC